MSNVLIGIIGVILFIGLAIASAVFLGPQMMQSRIDAQAVNYLSQSGQISKAIQDYSSEKGSLPIDPAGIKQPVQILVETKYLKTAPPGGASAWTLNTSNQALTTAIPGDLSKATQICVAARQKARMPNPENILKCDGSDAPGGALSISDPCCI